jgi:hypothetical protein
MNNDITFVTGLWDIGRNNAGEGFKRDFNSHYVENFKHLLKLDINLVIYCGASLAETVWQHRQPNNTKVIIKEVEEFSKSFDFFQQVQKIRNNEEWKNQAEWLKNSPQSTLEYYNPIIMSKFFMLHDISIMNPFGSKQIYWIDGGIASTVNLGYFSRYNVDEKLTSLVSNLVFLCFPYDGQVEVHGFTKGKFNEYAGQNTEYVARGGFFGGSIHAIRKLNGEYYGLLRDTINEGFMGTEESIFTLMCYKFPDKISCAIINGDGLINKFFEDIKNNTVDFKKFKQTLPKNINCVDDLKVYVLTFNSPPQLKLLLKNFEETYPELLKTRDKVLINNSNTTEYEPEYNEIAAEYNFKIQKFDNIGINRARQWVAEDFDNCEQPYYIFFEDDMLFSTSKGVCKNGFATNMPGLFDRSLKIAEKEKIDYLKISHSEFFGDNFRQWAYCNVPAVVRNEHFGDLGLIFPRDYNKLPYTTIEGIKTDFGVSYALGEFYYCNWPIIFSKDGNKKVFLDTKWGSPFEQTWMSFVFQEQRKKNIKSGCLLLSPIAHNRVYFYKACDRKEN